MITSGSNRGDRHRGGHDSTKAVPIITEVRERSQPDIPHLTGPECLVEDRITHSVDSLTLLESQRQWRSMMTGACCTAKRPNEVTQVVGTVGA